MTLVIRGRDYTEDISAEEFCLSR